MKNRPNDVFMRGDGFSAVPHALITELQDAKAIGLYAILAMHADWQTGMCHPSVTRLSQMMGYSSRKALDKALQTLVDNGWVEVFPRWLVPTADGDEVAYEQPAGDGWRQTSNGYILHRSPHTVAGGTPFPIGKGGSSLEGRGGVPYREHEQEPINKNQRTRTPLTPQGGQAAAGGFEEFWTRYPRKVAKPTAERAYRKALKRTDHDTIMDGLARSMRSWTVEGRDKTKIPHASTWLNQDRWGDEETTAADMGGQETALDVLARMRGQETTTRWELNQ